jgi:uncharacterized protein YgiM (DUF1202 family)
MRDAIWKLRGTIWSLLFVLAGWFVLTIPSPDVEARGAGGSLAEARMIDQLRTLARPPNRIESPLPDPAETTLAVAQLSAGATPRAAGDRMVVVPEALNVRSAPSTESEVLGRLLQGEAVDVAGREGGWVRIATANGTTGWASADYLAKAN